MKKMIFSASLLVTAFSSSISYAFPVTCTNCSQSAIQMLQHALETSHLAELKMAYDEYIQQTAQQIEMVRQNIEQYENMVKNTLRIPADLINNVKGEFMKLSQITSQIRSLRNDILGISNVFDELYKSQEAWEGLLNVPKELMEGVNTTYKEDWKKWSKHVDDAVKATFQISGVQLKELSDSGELESYVDRLLETPEGQMQAIMAGNQLSVLQMQEMRKLRELVATKMQSDAFSQEKSEKESQFSYEKQKKFNDLSGINENVVPDKY